MCHVPDSGAERLQLKTALSLLSSHQRQHLVFIKKKKGGAGGQKWGWGADKRIGVVTWSPLYCSSQTQHRKNCNAFVRRAHAAVACFSVGERFSARHRKINTQRPLLSGNTFGCLFNMHSSQCILARGRGEDDLLKRQNGRPM